MTMRKAVHISSRQEQAQAVSKVKERVVVHLEFDIQSGRINREQAKQ